MKYSSMLIYAIIASMIATTALVAGVGSSAKPAYNIPPAIVQNIGQARYTDDTPVPHIDGLFSTATAQAYIHSRGMHVALRKSWQNEAYDLFRVDYEFVGGNPSPGTRWDRQTNDYMTYLTSDVDGQLGKVANRYTTLTYSNVWRKIDVRISIDKGSLKIDYIVHPGGNPSDIALRIHGAESIESDKEFVSVHTPLQDIIEDAPYSYTTSTTLSSIDGSVPCSYRVQGNALHFDVGDYDKTKILIVDPRRVWATYFTFDQDMGQPKNCVDQYGNVSISSYTVATKLPKSIGVLQRNYKAGRDGYIASFTDEGIFRWCTYFGGSGNEIPYDIAQDKRGIIYAVGTTDSPYGSLPFAAVGSAPFGDVPSEKTQPDKLDGFVIALSDSGKYADHWYFFGIGDELVHDICIVGDYMAVAGTCSSPRLCERVGTPFTHTTSFNYAQEDMWAARLKRNPATGRWAGEWITFLGSEGEDACAGVGMDDKLNVYVAGTVPVAPLNTTDGTYSSAKDVILAKFVTPASSTTPVREWMSVFGGSLQDNCSDIAVDAKGNVVAVGHTTSTNFPLKNALRSNFAGMQKGFVRKYNTSGTPQFSTYFGSEGGEHIKGVAIDKLGHIWLCGEIDQFSRTFPVTPDAFQTDFGPWDSTLNQGALQDPMIEPDSIGGTTHGYFAQMQSDGQKLLYSTLYGGWGDIPPPFMYRDSVPVLSPPYRHSNDDFGEDYINGIVVEGDAAYIHLISRMQSTHMETTPGAYMDSTALSKQTVINGSFVAMFTNCKDTSITIGVNGSRALCPGTTTQLVAPQNFSRYLWSTKDTTRTITVSTPGRYILIAINAMGCRYRDTIDVVMNAAPVLKGMDDITPCLNVAATLSVNVVSGTAPYTYKWNRIETGPEFIDNDASATPKVNPGSASRYEVIVTDANGCSARDTVMVSPINPLPTLSSNALDFGMLGACESAKDIDVVVTNPMGYPIYIETFTASSGALVLTTSLATPVRIDAGSTATITLRANALGVGVNSGTWKIGGSPCTWAVGGTFTFMKAKLMASVTPAMLSFGSSMACDVVNVNDTVFVTNASTESMVLNPYILMPSGPPFTIVLPTFPIVLGPGNTAPLIIKYQPQTSGIYSTVMLIPYEIGSCIDTLRVAVNAAHDEPSITMTPASLNIGRLSGCTASKDTTITIRNTGTVSVNVSLAAATGLTYAPAGPYTIQAADSIIVGVNISPVAQGTFAATIQAMAMPCNLLANTSVSAEKQGSIVNITPEIDFGEVTQCGIASVTAEITLEANGSDMMVSTVGISPSFTTTLANDQALTPGSPVKATITWTPTSDGTMTDSMVVVFEPCGIRKVIHLTGIKTRYGFGPRQPAITHTTSTGFVNGASVYDNAGTDTVHIVRYRTTGTLGVTSTTPQLPATLLPGESIVVNYTFSCASTGSNPTALLMAEIDEPCSIIDTVTIDVTCSDATGLGPLSATFELDSVVVNTGDRFHVPIRIRQSQGLNAANAHAFTATISYHPGVIVGTGTTPDCFDGTYRTCSITVTGTRGNDTVGTIAELDFTAILGAEVATDVTLLSVEWNGLAQQPTHSYTSGHVTIGNICREGGERLLQQGFSTSISISPQPVIDILHLELNGLDNVPTTISIYDIVGSVVLCNIIPIQSQATTTLDMDVHGLATGTYAICITNGNSINAGSIRVAR